MKYIITFLLVLFMIGLMTPNAFANNVPEWVKNTAGWWATDAISETEFLSSIQWLVSNGIITLESESNNQPDEGRKNADGILTGEKCNREIDKDGDKVPDDLNAEGSVDW